MSTLKTRTKETIDRLSDKKVRAILDLVEYLEEKEAWEATFELSQNKKLLSDYQKARKDLKQGRTEAFIPWEKIRRNV